MRSAFTSRFSAAFMLSFGIYAGCQYYGPPTYCPNPFPELPVPCFDDRDCAHLGTRCNRASHYCNSIPDAGRPDGAFPTDASEPTRDASVPVPPEPVCGSSADCTRGQVCTAGSCRTPTEVCQFNFQCGAGRECVDGRCLTPCTPDAGVGCSSTQQCGPDGYCRTPDPTSVCTARCAVNERCNGNVCVSICRVDAECGTGNRCLGGTCVTDDRRAAPFCSTDAQCAAGSVCRNGVCRLSCATGSDEECLRRDVNFNQCSAERLCVSIGELLPQCSLAEDCPGGRTCIDGRCR